MFVCCIKTHFMMKTSSFYLLYDKHLHLLKDYNAIFSVESESASYEEGLRLLQFARKDAAIASYERALKNKSVGDKLVTSYELEKGQGVLIRHEKSQKFEVKGFESYQVIQKMLLRIYRFQDFNERELVALVHENHLIKANIRTADELGDL